MRALYTICKALSSISSPPSGSALIVRGRLVFMHGGLVSMNYSQGELHIPHGHCLRLKLEVLILLSTSVRVSIEWEVKRTV